MNLAAPRARLGADRFDKFFEALKVALDASVGHAYRITHIFDDAFRARTP